MKEFLRNQFIYNSIIIFNVFGVYRDIKDYFYSKRNLSKFKTKPFWKKLKCRMDWLGMPYLVLNFKESFFTELTPDEQSKKILMEISLIIKELSLFHSYEILTIKQKRIRKYGKDTNSILVYFRPVFYFISLKNIFFTTSILGYIIYTHLELIRNLLNAI